MGLAQLIVINIVGWCYLEATRTELNVHIAVLNNRNDTSYQWHNHFLAVEPLIFGIFGVNAHGSITHNSLGTSGGHHSIVAFSVTMNYTAMSNHFRQVGLVKHVRDIIFQIIELAFLVTIDYLLRREHGLCLGIPVDHTKTSVNKSLAIEINKNLEHAFGTSFIHSESRAIPIATCTETTQLLKDDAAVLMSPIPSVLQKLLTSEVTLPDTLFGQTVNNLGLSSNGGMVGAWYPQSILAIKACLAHQNILNGIIEHMSHVKHARHIWRRNNYCIRLTSVRLRLEQSVLYPIFIPFAFNLLGAILRCKFHNFGVFQNLTAKLVQTERKTKFI